MIDVRQRRFRLNGQLLDVSVNRIDGQPVEPKHVEVLLTLARSAPEPLSKAALLSAVWGDVAVAANVVHQAVAPLRHRRGNDTEPELRCR